MRRVFIAITVLLIAFSACALGYTLAVRRPATVKTGGARIVDGELQLLFPEGLEADAGSVTSRDELEFVIPFVNESSPPVELRRFKVRKPCCTPATLVEELSIIQGGERGKLRFRMRPSERPGRNVSRVAVIYSAGQQPSEEAGAELFAVQLAYTLQSRGLANWSEKELDFGDVWPGNGPVSRSVDLVVEQYGDDTFCAEVGADSLIPAVTVSRVGERKDVGLYDNSARIVTFKFILDADRLSAGLHDGFVVGTSPVRDCRLPVRWRVVDEYVFFPTGKLLVPRSASSAGAFRIDIRHAAGRMFQIADLSCTLEGVKFEDPATEAQSEASVMLHIAGAENSSASDGRVAVTLTRDDGVQWTRDIAIEFVDVP